MSSVIVRMRVKPEREERFLAIFKDVIAKMRISEPDARAYMVWRTQTPREYLLVESYTSEAGRDAHNAAHAGVFQEFLDCLEAPPETELLGAFVDGTP